MMRKLLARLGYIHKDQIASIADKYTQAAYEIGWKECQRMHTDYAGLVQESKIIQFPGVK